MQKLIKVSPRPGFTYDVQPEEVSDVSRPANRRPFFLIKSQESMMDELIQAAAAVELPNEAELEKSLRDAGTSDKGVEVAKALARLLTAYSDEFDQSTVAKSLGFTTETTEQDDTVRKEDLDALPEAAREKFERLLEENQANKERLEAIEGALEKSAENSRKRAWVEKAAGLDEIGLESDEIADILRSVEKSADEEAANKILETLRSVNAVAAASSEEGDLFKSFGGSGSGDVSDDPVYELSKRAEELRKENPELTEGQAMTKVLDSDSDLKKKYQAFNQSR